MALPGDVPMPARFVDLKKSLVPEDEAGRARFVEAWNDILAAMKVRVEEIGKATDPTEIIPVVEFADIGKLSKAEVDRIKRVGTVVVKNVVDDSKAAAWREELKKHVKKNPVEGIPEDDKQFFMLYWTRPQVEARADPNVLAATVWLNKLYHVTSFPPGAVTNGTTDSNGDTPKDALEGVDLDVPLVYADRFRIRHAGNVWDQHPPHIDGGGIERWEDPNFRSCFANILAGNWKAHDPYALDSRLNAKLSLYGRAGQASVFRTFQGWLALSETAPTQGTLQVFPDVQLSNAYLLMRPFFRPKAKEAWSSEDPLDAGNWELDTSSPDFPGIFASSSSPPKSLSEGSPPTISFRGPRLTPASHPHMLLPQSMTSVPRVAPGDMVFWHCDVVHAVETLHAGALPYDVDRTNDDSCVMYIGAVPSTAQNRRYVERQVQSFLRGVPPPDFPRLAREEGESGWEGTGVEGDVRGDEGRRAMGLAY